MRHEREREVPECKEQEYEAATASSPLHTAAAQHEPTQAVEHQSTDKDELDAVELDDDASLPFWRRQLARLIPQTLMGWPLLITYFLLTFAQVSQRQSNAVLCFALRSVSRALVCHSLTSVLRA